MTTPELADELEVEHGSYDGYKNHGCRCDDCRQGNRRYMAAWRARIRETGLAPDDPRHGTTNGHDNYGCRCNPCRAASFQARGEYFLRLARKTRAG